MAYYLKFYQLVSNRLHILLHLLLEVQNLGCIYWDALSCMGQMYTKHNHFHRFHGQFLLNVVTLSMLGTFHDLVYQHSVLTPSYSHSMVQLLNIKMDLALLETIIKLNVNKINRLEFFIIKSQNQRTSKYTSPGSIVLDNSTSRIKNCPTKVSFFFKRRSICRWM